MDEHGRPVVKPIDQSQHNFVSGVSLTKEGVEVTLGGELVRWRCVDVSWA